MAEIGIRPLERTEWSEFRDIRLLALKTNPGVFLATHEAAVERSPDEWKAMIGDEGRQVFGLFDESRLIGITGVYTASEDPSGSTAVLVMSFILPEYRGRGLSKLFYEARLQWIRARPRFSRVIVSHRKSNEASRRANQRHGFQFIRHAPRTWPDGSTEDEAFYEMKLR
jgi:RimJ/RimL family protein N-acetyltransferase